MILIDTSCWLFWACSNRTCLIQPLDSVTNTTMGKSEELSTDLKEHIVVSHPFQSSYRSQDQLHKQLSVSIKCMTQFCQCHEQKTPTITCCWEKTGQDGQESTKKHNCRSHYVLFRTTLSLYVKIYSEATLITFVKLEMSWLPYGKCV